SQAIIREVRRNFIMRFVCRVKTRRLTVAGKDPAVSLHFYGKQKNPDSAWESGFYCFLFFFKSPYKTGKTPSHVSKITGRFKVFPVFIVTFALTKKLLFEKANLRDAMKWTSNVAAS
ncbi:hypothetical protein, partial [uncultured Phocaeicola sp.]